MSYLTERQIVTATAAVLAGLPTAIPGWTVEQNRTLRVQAVDCPRAAIYCLRGTEDDLSLTHRPITRRTDTVTIDLHVRVTDGTWADDLSAAADTVKRLLLNNAAWLAPWETIPRVATTTRFNPEGDADIACATVEIDVRQSVEYLPLTDVPEMIDEMLTTYTHATAPTAAVSILTDTEAP